MPGKTISMTPLHSRKQLLIAESELNRVQATVDMTALAADIHSIADRARAFGSMASSAAVLVAGLTAFRRGKSTDADEKPGFFQKALRGIGIISTFWLAFRSRSSEQKDP